MERDVSVGLDVISTIFEHHAIMHSYFLLNGQSFAKEFIDDDDAIIPVIPEPIKHITLWEESKQEKSSELSETLEKLEFSETNNINEIWRLRVRSSVINLGEMAALILSDGPREKPKSSASSPSPSTSAKTSPLRTTNQTDVCCSLNSKETETKPTKTSPWKRPEGEDLQLFTDLRKCRNELLRDPKRHREDDNADYILENMNCIFDGREFFKRQKKDGIIDDLIKKDVVNFLKKRNQYY
ncbi:hypothetical protein V9T40_011848 [Parthenolecanium corni]|uniref:Uncharacterized protein n=1 Tax=Parthenolecanium corni TaxID=536013 RepID=A0AAN9TJF5_9HEMI